MARRLLLVCALAAFLVALPAPALGAGFTKTETSIVMTDGASLAASYYEPTGTPPTAGWPAIVMFHGLGGTRASMNTLAENSFANQGYAILTFDFHGHGQSGGLFSGDGPREVADFRTLYDWLAVRPEIDETHVGAWGISLGGGAVWRSLVERIPFAAAEVVETWTDLYGALLPQDLSKSGAIFGFLSSVAADRTAPEALAIRSDAMRSTNLEALKTFAAQRSSRSALGSVTTPVFMFQGRRDFAFGIDEATSGFQLLKGPRRLYIGNFGHAPSTFPGPDIAVVLARGSDWFARFLKGQPNGIDTGPQVELAPEPYRETPPARYTGLPPTKTLSFALGGRKTTLSDQGKLIRTLPKTKVRLETFGSPVVTVTAPMLSGWPHLVGVLTALTPGGGEVVVSEGGASTARRTSGKLTIRMIFDATVIPRGSRLRLTLAATSTAQDPANLLYLEGVPAGARITIARVALKLPVLRQPISP